MAITGIESPPTANAEMLANATSSILQLMTADLISGSRIYESDMLVEESTVSELGYLQLPTYRLDSGYNYYTDYYENITNEEAGILESGLPNLYIYGDDSNKDNPIYNNIITVGNTIEIQAGPNNNFYEYFDNYASEYQMSLRTETEQTPLFESIANLQNSIYYTKECIKRIEDINRNQFLMPYGNKIKFRTNELSEFSAILEDTGFIDIFCKSMIDYSKTNFTNLNLNILSENTVLREGQITTAEEITRQTLNGVTFNTVSDFSRTIKTLLLTSSNILSIGDKPSRPPRQRDAGYTTAFENNPSVQAAVRNNQSNSISRAIRMAIFSSRISQFIKSVSLDPLDFVAGASFYTEAFMYQLDKIVKNGVVIQSFYMPNLIDVQEVNLFDSQVKFGKKYNYSLKTFNFSLGQRINIELLNNLTAEQWIRIIREAQTVDPIFQNLAHIILTREQPPNSQPYQGPISGQASLQQINFFVKMGSNRAKNNSIAGNRLLEMVKKQFKTPERTQNIDPEQIRIFVGIILKAMLNLGFEAFIYYPIIFKKEAFNDMMAVFDHPPSPPEVQIDGMIGIDNKIFLRLNGSISEFKAEPVLIQPEDKDIFDRNVLVQKLDSLQEPMMFDGDDRPMYFQIFKLEHQPKDYVEFKDNFVTASTTYIPDKSTVNRVFCDPVKTNHSSYVDTISPNQKYYYMFRTVDVHGNISNPSPIYEVEMVNENGTIFPLIKIVDLLKVEDKQSTKGVKRFLHIVPSATQTLVNEQASGYYDENGNIKESAELVKDNVVLGLTEQKVWNKNYRLKIKSKVTGKVVEIDFKFTHKTLPNPAICE